MKRPLILCIARAIKQQPADLKLTTEENLPKDAMVHPGWDSMTAQERDFFQENLFAGWDEADRVIAAFERQMQRQPDNKGYSINAFLTPQARDQMAAAYFGHCIEQGGLGTKHSAREPIHGKRQGVPDAQAAR